MARGRPGGISGLHQLLAEHGEAIEYDLLKLGLDLADLGGSLSYRRLGVILSHSPRDSAYCFSAGGADSLWSLTDQLLALVIDGINAGNWQRGGGKGSKPKSLPRPGVKQDKGKRFGGGKVVPFAVLDRLLLKKKEG